MKIQQAGMLQQVSGIQQNQKKLGSIYEKLATGKKVNRASDDVAMMAMAKELEKQVRGFQQSDSNIGDALGAMRIAEGTGSEVSNMLQRQNELALQASNGTLNQSDREALNSEYQALSQEINRISESSNYNGQNTGAGGSRLSDGSGVVQAGASADNQRNFTEVDYTAKTPGGDLLSAANAQNALGGISDAMKHTNQTRANLGAQMNALGHTQSNLSNSLINTTNALSLAEDLDFAQGIMEKSKAELLGKSAMSATNHFKQVQQASMMSLLS